MAIKKKRLPNKWVWDKENGGKFSKINRPVSGATHKKQLPKGKHNIEFGLNFLHRI